MSVYSKKQAQIGTQSKAKIRILLFDKVLTEISVEYSDYSNVFSVENVAKYLEIIRINKHAIKLKKSK